MVRLKASLRLLVILGLNAAMADLPGKSWVPSPNFMSSDSSHTMAGLERLGRTGTAFLPGMPFSSIVLSKPWVSGCPQERPLFGQLAKPWADATEFGVDVFRSRSAPSITQLYASTKGKENRRRRMLRIGEDLSFLLPGHVLSEIF